MAHLRGLLVWRVAALGIGDLVHRRLLLRLLLAAVVGLLGVVGAGGVTARGGHAGFFVLDGLGAADGGSGGGGAVVVHAGVLAGLDEPEDGGCEADGEDHAGFGCLVSSCSPRGWEGWVWGYARHDGIEGDDRRAAPSGRCHVPRFQEALRCRAGVPLLFVVEDDATAIANQAAV